MILLENHNNDVNAVDHVCSCSYCNGQQGLRIGLNVPRRVSPTSWFVVKLWHQAYLRFTLPLLDRWPHLFLRGGGR